MLELAGDAGLVQETRAGSRLYGLLGEQLLERYVATDRRIGGEPYAPEPAFAVHAHQLVAVEQARVFRRGQGGEAAAG